MSGSVRVLQELVFYALLLLLAILLLIWNAIALCLYPFLSEAVGRRVGRAGIAFGFRLFWTVAGATGIIRLDLAALDPLRREPGGLIIAANHPSLLDGLLIASRLPRTCCIMKASLMRNIFLGAGAKLARYISNDRPLAMMKAAVADLGAGSQLLIFPEGTRTVGGPVNPFKPGMTLIAKLADVPLQTAFIETQSPYLAKGWPLWRQPPLPIVFRVRLGERFKPEADHAALLHRMERYFLENLALSPSPMQRAS